MNIKKSHLVLSLMLALLIGVGGTVLVTYVLKSQGVGSVKVTQKEYNDLIEFKIKYGKLDELRAEVVNNYYVEVDEEKLFEGMYRGLFASLDDQYSSYMTEDEYEAWIAATLSEFEGIGITFEQDTNGNFIILSVEESGPAYAAGLRTGDIVTKVDGKTFDTAAAVGKALRGDAGTKVKVTYLREKEEKEVSVTREKIINKTVKSEILEDNIGYISISAFEKSTAKDFKKALSKMEAENVAGIIIDLRDNGGGLVSSGTEIADALLGSGNITYLEDQRGEKEYIESDSNRTNLPYVLLVNENTASTSEIVAGAIKDLGPGKVVGTKTFGKGIVQTTNQLEDGSAFKLTVMRYFSPDGKKINGVGVTPTIEVENEADQMAKAKELLK